ncbi:SPOR domain-containing protein [Ottowia sp.]|uniref:SPOR domain-containing protein n=1 Tax=Ottowia sp. TaxID=1898956 RepID=UPI003A888E0B
MAFFKFRQRGQAPAEAPNRAAKPTASLHQESIDNLRRRARHRLLGAAVLVLAAVVGFPMLFDTQPRPVAVNAPITIPDKDSVAPLPGPDAVNTRVPDASSLGEREEVLSATPNPGTSAAAPATPATTPPATNTTNTATNNSRADARAAEAAERTRREEQAKAQREEAARETARTQREEDQAKRDAEKREAEAKVRRDAEAKARREAEAKAQRDEAARARAILEGRGSKPATASTGTNASSNDQGRFVIQVGAFAEDSAVRSVRQKAERAGVKTYTQVVNTSGGKRTRVRVGPFSSRAEAEKAAATLKKAGLSGSILSL